MTFQITPLAAKVNNLNGSSNASSVSGAKVLYIMGTAADTITNKNTGASFQIAPNCSFQTTITDHTKNLTLFLNRLKKQLFFLQQTCSYLAFLLHFGQFWFSTSVFSIIYHF